MKRISFLAFIMLVFVLFSGCENKKLNKIDKNYIEGIKYEGEYIAESNAFKVYDFVYMYFSNNSTSKEEAFNSAHLFTVSYYNAKQNNALTDNEKEYILELCDSLTKDNAELYLNMGLSSVEQYKLFSLMENTINKYKSTVFGGYEVNEEELLKYYNNNALRYNEVLLQVLYYSVKDENGNKLTDDVIKEKTNKAKSYIDKIKNSAEMDELILEESEDPAVSETGGKLNFILGEYKKDDHIYDFSSSPDRKTGDMTVIVDEFGIYLVRFESLEDYNNSQRMKDRVKNDYFNLKFEENLVTLSKTDNYLITDIKNELVDAITKSTSIEEAYLEKVLSFTTLFVAMLARGKEMPINNVISKLSIQKKASNIFIVIQEEGTACSFYAYTKENNKWRQEFFTSGFVGKNGVITEGKVEGDGFTPSGIYTFGKCFGINDDPGNVPLGYTKLTERDYWDSNPDSDTYNEWIKESQLPNGFNKRKYEHLISYKESYNYVASINYNTSPVVKGKGSAIFLHCTREQSNATAGCVAIPEEYMKSALQMIYSDTYIIICKSMDDFLKLK